MPGARKTGQVAKFVSGVDAAFAVERGHNNMSCEEKKRLASEYENATTKFSHGVAELRKRMGTSTKEEYQRLDRASNEASVISEHARLALEQHAPLIVADNSDKQIPFNHRRGILVEDAGFTQLRARSSKVVPHEVRPTVRCVSCASRHA